MQTEAPFEKLKLEHLAPYLPYDLTYFSPKHVATSMIDVNKDESIEKMGPVSMISMINDCDMPSGHQRGVKPILRPLSDLVNEIEFNGEKIIPLVKMLENTVQYGLDNIKIIDIGPYGNGLRIDGIIGYLIKYTVAAMGNTEYTLEYNFCGNSLTLKRNLVNLPESNPSKWSYQPVNFLKFITWLYKMHFDIYGLIEKGLAIDINKLKA